MARTGGQGMGLGMFGVDLESTTSELPPPLPPELHLGGSVWLVVGRAVPLSQSDSVLQQLLRWLGTEVHTFLDGEFTVQPPARQWPGVHAVVVSASVREGFLRGSPLAEGGGPSVPLVVLDGPTWRVLQLARRHERAVAGGVHVVEDQHALASGLRRGHVPFYEKPGGMAAATGAALCASRSCVSKSAAVGVESCAAGTAGGGPLPVR